MHAFCLLRFKNGKRFIEYVVIRKMRQYHILSITNNWTALPQIVKALQGQIFYRVLSCFCYAIPLEAIKLEPNLMYFSKDMISYYEYWHAKSFQISDK